MKFRFSCALVLVSAVLLMVPQDSTQLRREIDSLRQERDSLRVRVAQLETWLRTLGVDPSVPNPLGLPNGTLVMKVEEIRPYSASDDDRRRTVALTGAVNGIKSQMSANRKKFDDKDTGALDRRNLSSEYRGLQAELVKAEKALRDWQEFLRQQYWLLGWDGARDAIVRTTVPDDPLVKALQVGQFVAWEGEVIQFALGRPAAYDYSMYVGTNIRAVVAPPGFRDRSSSREPAWLKGNAPLTLPREVIDRIGQ